MKQDLNPVLVETMKELILKFIVERIVTVQNKLDNYDTVRLNEARNIIMDVYNYNFKSRKDPLSAKLETVLKKIDHILEEYGEQN
jgi:hypothetical protein